MGAPQITSDDEKTASHFSGYGDPNSPGAEQMRQAYTDPNLTYNKEQLGAALASRQAQAPQSMQAATIGPAQQANTGLSYGTAVNGAPQAQTRDQQNALGGMLMQSAQGNGPSVAQAQLRQATDQNIAQQQALAASMRGVNPALAARNAAVNSAQIQQQSANQSAIIRAQEQQSAQGQLGGLLSNVRGQDIGLASETAQLGQQNQQFNAGQQNQVGQFNAGQQNQAALQQGLLSQQANQTNLSSGIEQQKQLDDMTRYYTSSGLTLDQAQFAAKQQMAQQEQNAALDRLRIGAGLAGQASQQNAQMGGAAIGAMATLGSMVVPALAASDRNLKTDIKDGKQALGELLSNVKPYSYRYKDEEQFGPGDHVSAMAQDLEKSSIGRSMVVNTPRGKMVDYGKGLGAMLASLADQNERLGKLEKK